MKLFRLLIFSLSIFTLSSVVLKNAVAQETNCEDRYLTIVNPIRARDYWSDKTINPLIDQSKVISESNNTATWIVQYDVMKDSELLDVINNLPKENELGVLLEVSERLAYDAGVLYPLHTPWASPNALFLSGYDWGERRKLIDTLFNGFSDTFGYYPRSVGAWWIDSYSLSYMREKYEITSAMIVAEQSSTDNYGVSGQWWGVAYFPRKENILLPASNFENKIDVVVVQWAMRDLTNAYCDGPKCSNYSLQANDYTERGEDTEYFTGLVETYLNCRNDIAQVTVGLEVGIEGASNLEEFENQMNALKDFPTLRSVTLSEFAIRLSQKYSINPETVILSDENSKWVMSTSSRENEYLNDKIDYEEMGAFSDYFVPDGSGFLDRNIKNNDIRSDDKIPFPYWAILTALAAILLIWKRYYMGLIMGLLFTISSGALLLLSDYKYGWVYFYGPVLYDLSLVKAIIIPSTLVIVGYISEIFWRKGEKFKTLVYLIPASFFVDYLIKYLRFAIFEGKYYFGFIVNPYRLAGVVFQKPLNVDIGVYNLDLVSASAFLKFKWEWVWDNAIFALIVFPLLHIIIAIILWKLFMKIRSEKIRRIGYFIIGTLFVLYLADIYMSSPQSAVKYK